MISGDSLDVILRVKNLRRFQTQMREAAASVKSVGAATRTADEEAAAYNTTLRRQEQSLLLVRKAAKWTALTVAAVGFEAYKMSISFDRQMELIHTQAGASQKQVDWLHKKVLDMAGDVPQGPEELAKGLFHLESVGLRGKKALDALHVAAEGAAVGNADLEQVSTALGSAWLANIKGAGNLHHVMSILNATVGAGNMRMDELVTSLGTGILPAAKVAGIGIYDVMGALALLKDEGWGAYGSMAQLATALHFLYAPSTKAQKAMAQLGLGAMDLNRSLQAKGLPATLRLLDERLRAFSGGDMAIYRRQLAQILPGGRGRVMLILMNQLDRYDRKLKQIHRTQGDFGDAIKKTMDQPLVKLHKEWSTLQAALIRFGDAIKGPVTIAISVLFEVLIGLVKVLAWFFKLLKIPLIRDFAAAIFGVVVAMYAGRLATILWSVALKAWAIIMAGVELVKWAGWLLDIAKAEGILTAAQYALNIAMDANPIGLLIVAIGALVGGLIYAYHHSKTFRHIMDKIWEVIKKVAHWVGHVLVKAFHGWGKVIHWIWQKLKPVWHILKQLSVMHLFGKGSVLGGLSPGAHAGFLGTLTHVLGPIPGLAGGGYVTSGGAVMVGERGPEIVHLPRGASVTSNDDSFHPDMSGSAHNRPIILYSQLKIGKKVLAEAVSEHIEDKKARR